MRYVLSHYKGDWTWVKEYTNDYVIFNRSGEDIPGSIKTENLGDADYDRLTFIVDNYFDLPDTFLLTKSNLFKFIERDVFDSVCRNTDFTPLLTKNHKTYEPVCRYADNGMYEEINNSWYVSCVGSKYFKTYKEFAEYFHIENPQYLQFAPGGNYIVTRERIHRYGLGFYKDLRAILPYSSRPGEAHMIERSYYNLWK